MCVFVSTLFANCTTLMESITRWMIEIRDRGPNQRRGPSQYAKDTNRAATPLHSILLRLLVFINNTPIILLMLACRLDRRISSIYPSIKSKPPKYSHILVHNPSSSPSPGSPPKIRRCSVSSFSRSSRCLRSRVCHARYRLCQWRAVRSVRRLCCGCSGGAATRIVESGHAAVEREGSSNFSLRECVLGMGPLLWLPRVRRRLWRLILFFMVFWDFRWKQGNNGGTGRCRWGCNDWKINWSSDKGQNNTRDGVRMFYIHRSGRGYASSCDEYLVTSHRSTMSHKYQNLKRWQTCDDADFALSCSRT